VPPVTRNQKGKKDFQKISENPDALATTLTLVICIFTQWRSDGSWEVRASSLWQI